MTASSPDVLFRHNQDDAEWLAISRDSKYGHYARIPGRICRCLEYFNISSDRSSVQERLDSYYLFIGVVDDEIDSVGLEAGSEVLKQLENGAAIFGEQTKQSPAKVVTEALRRHIGLEMFPVVLGKLRELYQAVVRERNSRTMRAYVEQRIAIGNLTAEVSYLLMRPFLKSEHEDLRRFLQRVGAVGCLIDSVIDLREDDRLGLLALRPSLSDYLYLMSRMLPDGFKVLLRHPSLLGLFLEAISDNWLASAPVQKARDTELDDLSIMVHSERNHREPDSTPKCN